MKNFIEGITNNSEVKKNAYFIFYLIFFIILFILILTNNKSIKNECPKDNSEKVINIEQNYSFRHEINIDENITVLSGSRYNNEFRIDKINSGITTKYYIHFNDVYKYTEDSKWVVYNDNFIENIDEKLINLDYIKELITEGKEQSRSELSMTFLHEKTNITIEVNYTKKGDLDLIKIKKDNTIIKLKYYDFGLIDKFDIVLDNTLDY